MFILFGSTKIAFYIAIASALSSLWQIKSGIVPGDSTANQLISLYDTFCQALDTGKEVRIEFCDISNTVDRVWHTG